MAYQVSKSEDEWREELGADRYAVLRESSTERPWTGELLDEELLRDAHGGMLGARASMRADDDGCRERSLRQLRHGHAVALSNVQAGLLLGRLEQLRRL